MQRNKSFLSEVEERVKETEKSKRLAIIMILIVAAMATGLLFGLLGKIFNLPSRLINIALPAVVGSLAAFLVVRRKPVIEQQNKS